MSGARAHLLRRRAAQGALSVDEAKVGIKELQVEASRVLSDTQMRRASVASLFGERCAVSELLSGRSFSLPLKMFVD